MNIKIVILKELNQCKKHQQLFFYWHIVYHIKSDQSDQSKEEVRSIEGEFLGDSCCKYKNIDTDWINTLRVYLLQVRTDVNI